MFVCMCVCPQGVEARAQEREFLKMQAHGELDDARLVDGYVKESCL